MPELASYFITELSHNKICMLKYLEIVNTESRKKNI